MACQQAPQRPATLTLSTDPSPNPNPNPNQVLGSAVNPVLREGNSDRYA